MQIYEKLSTCALVCRTTGIARLESRIIMQRSPIALVLVLAATPCLAFRASLLPTRALGTRPRLAAMVSMCDAAATPEPETPETPGAPEPDSLEALKAQLIDLQRELKTKEKTADTQLQVSPSLMVEIRDMRTQVAELDDKVRLLETGTTIRYSAVGRMRQRDEMRRKEREAARREGRTPAGEVPDSSQLIVMGFRVAFVGILAALAYVVLTSSAGGGGAQ